MKLKRFLTYGLLLGTLAISSCGDDGNESLKDQFSFDGETISLKGANLYLTNEDDVNEHIYRNYFISDGTYTNGSSHGGLSFNDYEGATYILSVVIAVPKADEIKPGKYPQLNDWDLANENSKFGHISMMIDEEGTDFTEYYTDDTNEDESPVEVTGGVEHGEKMNIKFSGKLTLFKIVGGGFSEKTVTGKFFYSGIVSDNRVGI